MLKAIINCRNCMRPRQWCVCEKRKVGSPRSSGSLRWVRYPANGLYVSGEWEIHNSASEGSRTGLFMLLKGGKLIGSFDRLREAKRHAETEANNQDQP
jgi:hypothetical protein